MQPPEPFRDLDWEPKRARELGDRALDLWVELLERLPDLPIGRKERADEVRAAVTLDVPEEPMPLDDLMAHLRSLVLEHSMYPGHPGFMAYVSGAGTIPGVAGDMIAAAVNQNLGGWRLSPAATELELHLTRWLAQQFGLPADTCGGLLTSGGAMANFIGLKAARDFKAGFDTRARGLHGGPRMTVYTSEEVHSVVDRAADMIGIGTEAVRHLPIDDCFRVRAQDVRGAIEADLAAGARPIAIVGSAGSVATGSIDPLNDLADLAEEFGLWFHVDGAYGGPGILADDLRPLYAGIERADSIAFDPHKWLYTPHSGGCVVVRDMQRLPDAFSVQASYIYQDLEATGRGQDIAQLGPQFSRGFQALKVWVSLLAHGRAAYARRIGHDAALARYLDARATERPDFEVMAPTVLSICCFRYVPEGLPDGPGRDGYLDRLNEQVMTQLQLDGRAYCSNAVLRGRFTLRACIVNFRTEAAEIDKLLDVAAEIGARIDRDQRPKELR
ncbi:MAG: pyridoxal phosphate-dependent decarboxylase family protein [Actinomycetota bacterium]